MVDASEKLDEVVITDKDPLTRKQKLMMFRRMFLGKIVNENIKIKNEKDLVLRYSSSRKTLTVKSKKTLIIYNKYLGYKLEYSLVKFTFEQRKRRVLFFGTTKFTALSNRKKYLKRRKETYSGSILHFMRSIYTNTLKDNKFGLTKKGWLVSTKDYMDTKLKEEIIHVKTNTDTIPIVYYAQKKLKLSKMIVEGKEFRIDQLGNYISNLQVLFSGNMGTQKVFNMLPLNYTP